MTPAGEGRPDAQAQIQGFVFATLLLDPELCIAEANNAAEEMLGRSATRMVGSALGDVVAFEEERLPERLGAGDARLIARGTSIRIGERVIAANVTVSPIATHPGWRMLTLTDAGQDDMSGPPDDQGALRTPAVLAHEIKNPLASLRSALESLPKVEDPDLRRQLTEIATHDVRRIDRLVTDISEASRIGGTRRSPRPCRAAIAPRSR
ncbi:PAS domain-containing protein [Leptolyngbya sp. 15MV]|nr:PAS domain-containing protein [Leptolyngbya sp. 15MV]